MWELVTPNVWLDTYGRQYVSQFDGLLFLWHDIGNKWFISNHQQHQNLSIILLLSSTVAACVAGRIRVGLQREKMKRTVTLLSFNKHSSWMHSIVLQAFRLLIQIAIKLWLRFGRDFGMLGLGEVQLDWDGNISLLSPDFLFVSRLYFQQQTEQPRLMSHWNNNTNYSTISESSRNAWKWALDNEFKSKEIAGIIDIAVAIVEISNVWLIERMKVQ